MVAAKKSRTAPAPRPKKYIACPRPAFQGLPFCLVHELEQIQSEVERKEYERADKGLRILIAEAKSEDAS